MSQSLTPTGIVMNIKWDNLGLARLGILAILFDNTDIFCQGFIHSKGQTWYPLSNWFVIYKRFSVTDLHYYCMSCAFKVSCKPDDMWEYCMFIKWFCMVWWCTYQIKILLLHLCDETNIITTALWVNLDIWIQKSRQIFHTLANRNTGKHKLCQYMFFMKIFISYELFYK